MTKILQNPLRRRLCVIFNPKAGQRSHLFQETLNRLRLLGVDCDLKETRREGDATELARQAVEQGHYDAVVAGGGDGTFNEVANGLIGSEMPLGVIPVGSTNVLAYELGLDFSSDFFSETLAWGETRTAYPALVNGRYFLLMVGVGLDARAVAAVSPSLKRLWGWGAYGLAALNEFVKYTPPALRVTVEGQQYEATWVIVFKSARYAGDWVAEPRSNLETPGLTVILLRAESRRHLLTQFSQFISRKPLTGGNFCIRSVRRLRIEGDRKEPVQVDGDHWGVLPLEIDLSGVTLKLIKPPKKTERPD